MTNEQLLQTLISTMDIPKQRRTDYWWLARNIRINNQDHPLIEPAVKCLREILGATQSSS